MLGGLTGSIAGLASVATYPALLLVGLPPVTANVTNTVALVFNGIGSVWGSRPELEGQQTWIKRIAPVAVLGGAAGAALLSRRRKASRVVPILLGLASVRSCFRVAAIGEPVSPTINATPPGCSSSRPRSS